MESFYPLPSEWHQFVEAEHLTIHYRSKWFNSLSVTLEEQLIDKVISFPFVKSVEIVKELAIHSMEVDRAKQSKELGYALEQINASYLTDSLKLNGKGVKIGVVDGGFMKANENEALKTMANKKQIRYFKDYLLPENTDPYYGKWFSHDNHGTQVLEMIAGYDPENSLQLGMATEATYYLARTDHGVRENRLEEDYWLMAIENFYEQGIRLVNSSLGYTDGFDKRKENHKVKEVDGKSSLITQAAQKAAEKGMLIVLAAGNDGDGKWKTLSLPADANDVLTVGATRFDTWSKVYYSSIGPEVVSFTKPDISCFASNGTSFSAPIITGLAACIWQYDSTLTNYEVMDIIKKSGHLAEAPNNYLGHGVPNAEEVAMLLKGNELTRKLVSVQQKSNTFTVENDEISELVVFHKKDKKSVILQEIIEMQESQPVITITRKEEAQFTTVVSRNKLLIEIEWVD
ncbi:serine protease [Marivirga lumbricoides]|uniref:Serine protease n=2 Tax=Marivirga lumbricoides TaxID=1046115 RepID=A0ABQ1LHY2_9BACT|nr:serine protease [Marivirga lumbricoides]